MNVGQGVALGGSLVVVLVGFLIARALVPGPVGPESAVGSQSAGTDQAALGKWRPANTTSCADGRYMTIKEDQLVATFNKKDSIYPYDVRLEQTDKGPALRLHVQTEPNNVNFYLHLDVRDDTLKFVSADWSAESTEAYGIRLDNAGLRDNLASWQSLHPMHRCP